jgi:thiosulfate/3-mercaptopyruvate sulfurtransferase
MRTRHVFRHAVVTIPIGLLVACTSAGSRPGAQVPATIDSLVTTQWLSEHLGEPDLVVLDCTVRVERGQDGGFRAISGRADFESGHIPTAGFADLTSDLADGSSRFAFAVPAPERFAAAMGTLGVGDDSRVVLYSANDPAWAARVWWMLRWIGFDRAALLDGGLKAWQAEGRSLSTEPAREPARRLTVAVRPQLIADREEVRAAIGNQAITLVDSLPEASFQGKFALYGRPGHIAGAINIPTGSLLDESGHYLTGEKLTALHGGDRGGRVITYCGGGIAASSSAFVMTRLGFTNVAVYTASLQEWAADPANPMEVSTPE